jgi:hypothetical protein
MHRRGRGVAFGLAAPTLIGRLGPASERSNHDDEK